MKKLITAITIAVTLVLLGAGVMAISARGALSAIEKQSDDIIGLAIDVKGYSISWLSASFSLKDIKIYPAGKKGQESHLLASAEELKLRIMPSALLRKTLHAESVTLKKPVINVTEYTLNKYNWDVIDLGQEGPKDAKGEEKGKSDWHVWVEDVKINDGVISYRSLPGGHRVKLTDLEMSIKNIKSDENPEKLPTKLYIDGKIDDKKGKLKVKGRLNAFAKGINFKLRAWINDAPITYFRSFYAGQTPFPISSGRLNLTTKATAKKSDLVAHSTATIHNLKVGGGIKGKLVNSFLAGNRGPVVVNVTVKGDLDKGNFSTASAISRGISKGILAQAKKANPLSGTGEKAVEGTKSVGRKIKGLFDR